jgi:hypothetical protein
MFPLELLWSTMIYGITGISKGYNPELHDPIIAHTLMRVPEPTGFVTGCAFGVDTAACEFAYEHYPTLKHILVVPAAYHNETLVIAMEGKPNVQIVRCPIHTDYRYRNNRVVKLSGSMIAFPLRKLDIPRSGTWMTANIAKRAGKLWKVEILP